MKPRHCSILALLLILSAGCASHSSGGVAIDAPTLHAKQTLSMSSRSFGAGSAISRLYSNYGENAKPDVHWSTVPGAKSYALLVEDPDARGDKPFVHWIVWNIAPEASSERGQSVSTAAGSAIVEGKNDTGTVGYFGPRPPIGDDPHHYHFEVFALDETLGLAAGADREALVAAMVGHVLASGELLGMYRER